MKTIKFCIIIIAASIELLLIVSCSESKIDNNNSIAQSLKKIPNNSWRRLSGLRILFGHQSVGYDMIEGIRNGLNEYTELHLNIVEMRDINKIEGPVLAHFKVGQNKDAISKINDFAMAVRTSNNVDVAFFKFCYIDLVEGSDIVMVFDYYKKIINELSQEFPKTRFIHLTVPLRTVQTGIKAGLKKIIGKPVGEYKENILRNNYNELIRNQYEGKEPIFDLAKIESITPSGGFSNFTDGGKIYSSLYGEYTSDGGHLNETGRRVIAQQFLLFLLNL